MLKLLITRHVHMLTRYREAEVFSTHSNAPDAVAAEWLSRYERNNADAIRDLINLVLRATGCKFEVTTIDIEDQDNITGKLSDLQDEYQAVSGL